MLTAVMLLQSKQQPHRRMLDTSVLNRLAFKRTLTFIWTVAHSHGAFLSAFLLSHVISNALACFYCLHAKHLQAQIEAGKPMRTAWYRGSEHSSGPSIASTESAVSVKAKVS